ncbi:hypothetical protein C8Q74DRAFT_1278860 [Fomes fomentarius]|nr:hypothetical protein C8Q74DRAFT_1278860 [Fomes fomentarius]
MMSRPVTCGPSDLVRQTVRGPREPPLPPRTKSSLNSREVARQQIPVDKFLDVLQNREYYAELYPDVLPLTRRLFAQLRAQAGNKRGPNVQWAEPSLVPGADVMMMADGRKRPHGDSEAGQRAVQDMRELDVQTMRDDNLSPASAASDDSDEWLNCDDESLDFEDERDNDNGDGDGKEAEDQYQGSQRRIGSFLSMDDEELAETRTSEKPSEGDASGSGSRCTGSAPQVDRQPSNSLDMAERGEWAQPGGPLLSVSWMVEPNLFQKRGAYQ